MAGFPFFGVATSKERDQPCTSTFHSQAIDFPRNFVGRHQRAASLLPRSVAALGATAVTVTLSIAIFPEAVYAALILQECFDRCACTQYKTSG
jgi:hypothetical protein